MSSRTPAADCYPDIAKRLAEIQKGRMEAISGCVCPLDVFGRLQHKPDCPLRQTVSIPIVTKPAALTIKAGTLSPAAVEELRRVWRRVSSSGSTYSKVFIMSNRIVDITGEIRAQTEKAIQFYDGERVVWLPLSQIEVNDDGTVTMPEWLAMEKELI